METYYMALVGLLFLFAISDLIIGVSNDAVNFLNSAIGSKAAPFWAIITVASLGVLAGATFSNGMMEVARKGIFDPNLFFFNEIMVIFIAVMLTDIILLDTFNSLGMPTSTTVSIVFELLGAAVAISIMKISAAGDSFSAIGEYINTEKAMLIISGILLSVVISFTTGALIQYLTRLVFSFKHEKSFKYFGSTFAGMAVTAITYFLLVKGAKGSSFIGSETLQFIKENTMLIISSCFIGWTIILQIASSLFKFNILKFSVLSGTFALAMAFAGNDLVNFIGVPLAGFESFKLYMAAGGQEDLLMSALAGKVQTPTLYLLLAGMVMVLTLWLSRKARTVTATSLNLSSQNQGVEQFGSSGFARSIVRGSLQFSKVLESVIPAKMYDGMRSRFKNEDTHNVGSDAPSFDMIRATVNLCVAGILISIATSFKLPLSTTYVTFMVAMGTSLADGAWGRESAVYRITGVLTVIGGWFFTAFIAFTVCGIFAYIIHAGGPIGLGVILAVVSAVFINSKRLHKRKNASAEKTTIQIEEKDLNKRCSTNISNTLSEISDIYAKMTAALSIEDRKGLRDQLMRVNELNAEMKSQKDRISTTIKEIQDLSIENGHFFVQVVDYLREAAHCMTYIVSPSYDHINNQHKGLHPMQVQELTTISAKMKLLVGSIVVLVTENNFDSIDGVVKQQQELLETINKARKAQIKRIKNEETKTRNSMLFLTIVHESKSLSLHTINILKAYRDFALLN